MPGDAECISGMSCNLAWHQAENTLQAEMKACFSAACKYWAGDPLNFQLNSTTPRPGLHSLHVPTLTICINAFKIGSEAYQATLHLLDSLQSQSLWLLPGHRSASFRCASGPGEQFVSVQGCLRLQCSLCDTLELCQWHPWLLHSPWAWAAAQ